MNLITGAEEYWFDMLLLKEGLILGFLSWLPIIFIIFVIIETRNSKKEPNNSNSQQKQRSTSMEGKSGNSDDANTTSIADTNNNKSYNKEANYKQNSDSVIDEDSGGEE